jgi:uncharacterized membrane protein YeaQ/YmgE (transglycosylase-associated protein family)
MGFRVIVWVVSGLVVGWLTGRLIKGRGFGLAGDLVVGALGGLLGGWLFRTLRVNVNSWFGQIVVAVLGSLMLVAIVRSVRRV